MTPGTIDGRAVIIDGRAVVSLLRTFSGSGLWTLDFFAVVWKGEYAGFRPILFTGRFYCCRFRDLRLLDGLVLPPSFTWKVGRSIGPGLFAAADPGPAGIGPCPDYQGFSIRLCCQIQQSTIALVLFTVSALGGPIGLLAAVGMDDESSGDGFLVAALTL